MAVCDMLEVKVKTAIAMRALRPSMAVVDPQTTESMPSAVTACSGFDVLSHAIESYTARPHTQVGARCCVLGLGRLILLFRLVSAPPRPTRT